MHHHHHHPLPAARLAILLIAQLALLMGASFGHASVGRGTATTAIIEAVDFFTREVAAHGGYLFRYSADLKLREGEVAADDQTAWLEPPGTGYVGETFLYLDEQIGELTQTALDAARQTADCLINGQLESGGWDNAIYFEPKRRAGYFYRADHHPPSKTSKLRNLTTLDDNKTQSALRFLILLDKRLGFKDERLHEAVEYGLDSLLDAQYSSGAWPQRYAGPTDQEGEILKASYPETWSRTYDGIDYKSYYTFNDNTIVDTLNLMLLASAVYDDGRYLDAALKCGEFLLDAQMPEPQPGWAQQYDHDMHPAWARKFEPASISGGESGGVMRALLTLHGVTLDAKWLEPVERGLAFYEARVIPGENPGETLLPRFIELKTNRPLYFTLDYELTYDDSNMPTHYGFKTKNWTPSVRAAYEKALERRVAEPVDMRPMGGRIPGAPSDERMNEIVGAMDSRGAWVTEGALRMKGAKPAIAYEGLIIDTKVFAKNVMLLGAYVERQD